MTEPGTLCEPGTDYLYFEIKAASDCRVRSDFAVCNRNMLGMNGIALECFFGFESRIKHKVCIRRCKAVDVYLNVNESGNLAFKTFESFFYSFFMLSFSSAEYSSLSVQTITCFTISLFLSLNIYLIVLINSQLF